jgi:hypothetical protein
MDLAEAGVKEKANAEKHNASATSDRPNARD